MSDRGEWEATQVALQKMIWIKLGVCTSFNVDRELLGMAYPALWKCCSCGEERAFHIVRYVWEEAMPPEGWGVVPPRAGKHEAWVKCVGARMAIAAFVVGLVQREPCQCMRPAKEPA